MQANYSKYFTIPITLCIVAIFASIGSDFLNALSKGYLLSNVLTPLYFLASFLNIFLGLFIGALIFSIAYEQTSLSPKNTAYIAFFALAIIVKSLIFSELIHFILSLQQSLDYQMRQIIVSFLTLIVDPLSNLLILVGVNYLYAKFNHLHITPINNKLICLLYTGLFISLFIFEFFMANMENFYMRVSNFSPTLILGNIISLIIFFIYCYTWTTQLLSTKDTTNYPARSIFAFLLSVFIIIIVYAVCSFILGFIISSVKSQSQVQALIFCGTIAAYIFGIMVFIKLRNLSNTNIYSLNHWAFYIITFAVFSYIAKPMFSYLSGSELFYFFISFYGIVLFLISFSVYVLYIANKLSINLLFKEKNRITENNI